MNYFVTNRDVIKDLQINTGTSGSPTYTALCVNSTMALNMDFNEKTWYTFCNALQQSLITGVAITLTGTTKIDINNTAITTVLGDVHTLLQSGEISQFNNLDVKFKLLTGVEATVLTYTTYRAHATLKLEALGGNAEDEGEFNFTLTLNSTESVSA